MKKFGVFLLILGAGSAVLSLVGYELRLMMWVENWGTAIGWTIRGGLAVAGTAMIVLDRKNGA